MSPPPLFVSFQGMRRRFRRLRAASSFAHGGKGTKTPPGTRPMGYGCAYAPPRPIGRFPRTPLRGTHSCLMLLDFRRAKSEWSLAIPSGPTGALGLQKFRVYAIPRLRLALPSQRYRCRIRRRGDPCGRPQAFPLQGGRCPRRGRMRVTSWLAPGGSPKGLPYPDTDGSLAIRRAGAGGESAEGREKPPWGVPPPP